MNRVFIIGGGAAGMMAAVTAAGEGAEVTLIEHNDRVGKKILSTGNGRCNFTNLYQKPDCYQSDNPGFPWEIIQKFDVDKTVVFFKELGIYPKSRNGYLYPNSDQASAVLDVLRMEMDRLSVRVLTETKCLEILPKKREFRIKTSKGSFSADTVILAAGSKASQVSGADGSGYTIAKNLGHRILPVLPALVQLRCEESFYKSISGIRVQGRVELYSGEMFLGGDTGEIQLTAYGISGIPVFQVSASAVKVLYQGKPVKAVLNFMPDMNRTEMEELLKERILSRPEKTARDFLTGLFPGKLCDLWMRLSGISGKKTCSMLTSVEIKKLAGMICGFETNIKETNSFEQAQVCCGGIDTREVNPETMESLLIPGLYFAGEILDVNGLCGGYNLQWAWSSGRVAGKEAADASR